MDFDCLIKELKGSLGFETFTPDKEDIYRITINNAYIVCLARAVDSSDYFLYTTLCTVPSKEDLKSQLFEQFLSSHLFGKETHRAYFALDARQGTILLIRQFDTTLENIDSFMKELKYFVNTLVYWQEKLPLLILTGAKEKIEEISGNLQLNLERRV
ncbi:MAG: type III secretion system chaperone [Parachlamydia sp.]|nr:type III secretion system chaperone [Parachlamydia sp.]